MARAGNFYFHIDGAKEYPWYMGVAGYQRHLRENGKTQLRSTRVKLTNPAGAQAKLEELTARKWTWLLLPNNCASFVQEIFSAGGSNVSTWNNCPEDELGRRLMWYVLAGVLGLIAGAYACLGVIILVAPSMPSETALWYIYPSAILGVALAVLAVRKFKRRRSFRAT